MAIKSRSELEHKSVSDRERTYEQNIFLEAIRDFPGLSQQQRRLFWEDDELKGSYFADLQDEDKQKLFEEKLGTSVLTHFSSNKAVHMLRNEAIHKNKTKGRSAPYSAIKGRPLEVSNPKAFTYDGDRIAQSVENTAPTYEDNVSKAHKQLNARRIDPDEFGERTHSLGDTVSKTLYFTDRGDLFGLNAPSSFEYDGIEMGSAIQALNYAQALRMKDSRRALALGAEPMDATSLRKKSLLSSPYNIPDQKEELRANLSEDLRNVLSARYSQDEKAKQALLKTEGYRLVYASTDDELGIGQSIEDIEAVQETAVYENKEFIVNEKNRDFNNLIGRITSEIRNDLLKPEIEIPTSNPEMNNSNIPPIPESLQGASELQESSSENPFGDYEGVDEVRSIRDMDDSNIEAEVIPEPNTLEMSIHASPNITARGVQRASHAVKVFAKEASTSGKKPVVYVHKNAPNDLKKAVFVHNDIVDMKQLDENNIPNRSLIVQNEQTMTKQFQHEVIMATRNSDSRDVRALSVDPLEPTMYALNDYLVNKSDKVSVSMQSDGVESHVVEPDPVVDSNKSKEQDEIKKLALLNEQRNQQARESAHQSRKHNPAKGDYASNPFEY